MDQKYVIEPTVKIGPDIICSITGQLMTDPVILMQTGNTYDREAILSWLKKKKTDPLTNQSITDETIAPNDTLKRMISAQQDKQNALIDYLLRGDLEGAKQSESEGASFLYRNKHSIYPLVAAVYGTNLEALKYIEGKLKKEEAELQWSEVFLERAKKEIASEMPRELSVGATQRELAEWYENSGLEKMQGVYNALCLKIEGFDKWDSLGGCESFWGRAAWTRKQGRSWNDPPNIDLMIMDRACQSGRGNLFLPSRWTHDAVVNQIRNQINELKKLVETKVVKQPVIIDEKNPRSAKNTFENQKEKYLCPISFQIMAEPVTASDGHVYEKEKLEELLSYSPNPLSPLTREALNKGHPLVINLWMRGEIGNFLEENKDRLNRDDVYLPEKWKANFANAIRNGNETHYNEWLRKDSRLKAVELEPGKTAFELVCEKGTPERLKSLISVLGIEKVKERMLSKGKDRGTNPFYLAWSFNQWEVVKLLIDSVSLNPGDIAFLELDKQGEKPGYLNDLFLKSAQKGNFEEMKWFLALGADVNARDQVEQKTALHLLAQLNLFTLCQYLIEEKNARKDLKDNTENTALEPIFLRAVSEKNREKIECLLKLGADVNAMNAEGQTALHLAAQSDDFSICEYLVKSGINSTLKDKQGKTAFEAGFFKACEENSLEKMKTWLELGCDINACNEKGQTGLHIVSLHQWLEGCEFLLGKGIVADIRDNEGRNAFLACVNEFSLAQSNIMRKGIDALLNVLEEIKDDEDQDKNICLAIADALVELGEESPAVIDVLLKALRYTYTGDDSDDDDSDAFLNSAAWAVYALKNPPTAVIDELMSDLGDSYFSGPYCAKPAQSVLIQLGQKNPLVIDALLDGLEGYYADKVACMLVELGEESPVVIEALLNELRESSEDLNAECNAYLKKDFEMDNCRYLGERFSGVAKALGKLKKPTNDVINALIEVFSIVNDNDDYKYINICEDAEYALVQLGQKTPTVIEALFKRLSASDAHLRLRSARALVELGEKSSVVINVLHNALNSNDPDVQIEAARVLVKLKISNALLIDRLLKTLGDKGMDMGKREFAAESLGLLKIPTIPVIDALMKVLSEDEDKPWLGAIAAKSLGTFNRITTSVIDALIKGLQKEDFGWSSSYGHALVHLGQKNPEVIAALVKALEDQNQRVRKTVVEILGKIKPLNNLSVIEGLLKASKDQEQGVRVDAITALGKLKPANNPSVIEGLLKALKDQEQGVRLAAITALGKFKPATSDVIEALFNILLHEGEKKLRDAAACALVELSQESPELLERFVKGLRSKHSEIRETTACVLEELKAPTLMVIDALIKSLDIEDDVRPVVRALKSNLQNFLKNEQESNEKILNCLLKHKKSFLSSRDEKGNNALMLMVFYRQMAGVKWLVEKGISLISKNRDGNTALMMAVLHGDCEISSYLIEKMRVPEIESVNNEGDTGLIIAARRGNKLLMKLFLKAGADIEVKDQKQFSVLEILKKQGDESLVNFLNEQRKLIRHVSVEENKKLREEVDDLKEQMRLLQAQFKSFQLFVGNEFLSNNHRLFRGNENEQNLIADQMLPQRLMETSEQSVRLFHQFWLHPDNLAQLTARYLEKREQKAIACVNKTCYDSYRFFSVLPQQSKEKQIEMSILEGDKLGLN